MAAKKGTYLIEFWNGNKYVVGNNYKWWWYHAIELALDRWREVSKHQMFKAVYYSKTPFVDDGGLKFCAAEHYQQVIDEVAAETGKQLTPFNEYQWEKAPAELALLDKKLERW